MLLPKSYHSENESVETKEQSNSDSQRKLDGFSELRVQQDKLTTLGDYLGLKIEAVIRQSASPAVQPEDRGERTNETDPITRLVEADGVGEREKDPIARLATLFSVIIMGIVGAFVSNYSRVCALLKEATAIGISSADGSIRVRFSPFLGGLLAVVLAEIFGGHLIQGDLFPITESMPRWTDLIWSGQAYSKLLVWGFVAGLSENHVLRVLGSLVGKVTLDDKPQSAARP